MLVCWKSNWFDHVIVDWCGTCRRNGVEVVGRSHHGVGDGQSGGVRGADDAQEDGGVPDRATGVGDGVAALPEHRNAGGGRDGRGGAARRAGRDDDDVGGDGEVGGVGGGRRHHLGGAVGDVVDGDELAGVHVDGDVVVGRGDAPDDAGVQAGRGRRLADDCAERRRGVQGVRVEGGGEGERRLSFHNSLEEKKRRKNIHISSNQSIKGILILFIQQCSANSVNKSRRLHFLPPSDVNYRILMENLFGYGSFLSSEWFLVVF